MDDQDIRMKYGQMRFIFKNTPSCDSRTTSIGIAALKID